MSTDRIDLQFGPKECCRSMSRPTVPNWSKLNEEADSWQVVRGWFASIDQRQIHDAILYEYKLQDEQDMLTAYSDANWASSE